jgi:glycosyltransferase involved in cell wall biosynthesis
MSTYPANSNPPMSPPLVSVIMPAYNAEPYIAESIASVLAQTYSHWELVIADDGSTDNTVAVVTQFDDPRIRLLTLEHCGFDGKVRNAALRAARGDYIAFLDADDLYEPDALETLLNHLRLHVECTAVYGFKTFIDEKGRPVEFDWYTISHVDENGEFHLNPKYSHTWRNVLDGFCYHQLQSLMLPRATLKRVGVFAEDLYLHSDTHFYARLFHDHFDGVHYLEKPVFRHRMHMSSICTDLRRLRFAMERIPISSGIFYDLLTKRMGLGYSRSYLAGKLYAWYMAIRLDKRDYASVKEILRYALKDEHLGWPRLLGIFTIQCVRTHFPPAWVQTLKEARDALRRLQSDTLSPQPALIPFRSRSLQIIPSPLEGEG